jgi:hypothetical protein
VREKAKLRSIDHQGPETHDAHETNRSRGAQPRASQARREAVSACARAKPAAKPAKKAAAKPPPPKPAASSPPPPGGKVFARLAAELLHVMCVKVDADTHGAILKTYGVKAFPTFVLLRRKSELSRMQGADAGALEAAIRANAGKPDPWSTAKTASGRTLR